MQLAPGPPVEKKVQPLGLEAQSRPLQSLSRPLSSGCYCWPGTSCSRIRLQIKASSLDRPPGKGLRLPPEQKGGLPTATGEFALAKPL